MLTRQQITKGASIVAQMQERRSKIVREFCNDFKYYRIKKDWGDSEIRKMIHRRYKRESERALKPHLPELTIAIKSLSERLALEECPWYLPCGADDAWYEVRDQWRQELKRWCQAYKFLKYLERSRA